jgi:hypothetical protein
MYSKIQYSLYRTLFALDYHYSHFKLDYLSHLNYCIGICELDRFRQMNSVQYRIMPGCINYQYLFRGSDQKNAC